MRGGIYTITSPSGGQYVGSAVSFSKRWSRHRIDLEKGCHNNFKLQGAFRKYGLENLRFEKLLVCEPGLLLFFEQRAINTLKPRYNICSIAGSAFGLKHSAEACRKKSISMLGHTVSDKTRAKISASQKGKTLSVEHVLKLRGQKRTPEQKAFMSKRRKAATTPETREKIRLAVLGTKRPPRSPEWCKRISESAGKRQPISEETRAKMSAATKARWTRGCFASRNSHPN